MIERFRRVLFLGAHPDDEIGCAGTLARLTEAGTSISVVTFSDCRDLIPAGFTVDDLLGEWHAALELLGVREPPLLYGLPNRHLPEHRQAILEQLDPLRGRYDLVLLPASSDIHQDHATVSAEGVRAFKHATVLGYELPMNTIHEATWAGFVRLDPRHVETKVDHARTYRSQAARPYMAEPFIRGLAAVHGIQAGCAAAEAFEVIRWFA
jgi:LmbE family N-acetylglucosaminyl deacetylase